MPGASSQSGDVRDDEKERLRVENAMLRHLLAAHGISVPDAAADGARTAGSQESSGEVGVVESKTERARKRIALFMSLFRGREDVYARRWDNPDGRSGYRANRLLYLLASACQRLWLVHANDACGDSHMLGVSSSLTL